jgi:membrane fusion protein (multidrug efflux system)
MALDPSTRNLLVEIDLPNPGYELRPGTFTQVILSLRDIPDALVLPPQAIVSQGKTKSVFVVDEGRAKTLPIQTGISDGHWLEITFGLSGGEDVVVVGKQKLVEGAPVKASPFKLPGATRAQQKFERRSASVGQEPADKRIVGTASSQESRSPALPTRTPVPTR